MNILRLYLRLPPCPGGMENHIYRLSEYQRLHGHSVVLVFNEGEPSEPCDVRVLSYLALTKIRPQIVRNIVYNCAVIYWLVTSHRKFDVIHVHGGWSALIGVRLMRAVSRAEHIVLSIHDRLQPNCRNRILLPALLKFLDARLICSTGMQPLKMISNRLSCHFLFQPSGIDDQFFHIEKHGDRDIIVTVANLFPKKNIDLILNIAQALPLEKFIVIGDGPEKQRLLQRKFTEKIDNIDFVGRISKSEIIDYLSAARAFLITSYAEGTPTAALEALACGVPVVSSSSGGIESVIENGRHGIIVSSYKTEDFVDALRDLKLLSENGKVSSQECCLLAQKFRWADVSKRITDEMRQLFS